MSVTCRAAALSFLAFALSAPAVAEDAGTANTDTGADAGVAAAAAPSDSEEAPAPSSVKVAISPFAPFIMLEGNDASTATGFTLELWKKISADLNLTSTFVVTSGVNEKLTLLDKGEVDVAIGGITFTREREERMDFTLPTYRSGLGILVRADGEDGGFFSRVHLTDSRLSIILGFLLLIVIAGHLIWIAERGKDSFNDAYVKGVFEGMYWAIVTASTVGYGDKTPEKPAGRLVASLVIIISLPMFAIFTAELASAITVQGIQSSISSLDDLRRRPVAVVRGTTSASFAAQQGLRLVQFDRVDDAYASLRAEDVDAVIYDRPNLQHYVQGEGEGAMRLLEGTLLPQNLGIAVPSKSPLRERINRVLLELSESGEMQQLQIEWFGEV